MIKLHNFDESKAFQYKKLIESYVTETCLQVQLPSNVQR